MIVEDGVFHADHPGNVFYLPGNRIAFHRLRDDWAAVTNAVVMSCCNCCWAWWSTSPRPWPMCCWTGRVTSRVQIGQLETEIEAFVDQYHGVPLAQLRLGQMLADVTAILRDHRLALPSDLALLIKAFISLEGMGRNLNTNFHMASEALRCSSRWWGRTNRAPWRACLAIGAANAGHAGAPAGRPGPPAAQRGVAGYRSGIELAHLKRVGDQIDRSANRLAMAW